MREVWKNCQECYLPSLIGGLFLCVADLLQNDKQGQILKVGGIIRQHFAPRMDFEALIGLGFILRFSLALCWVFRPPNRAEAFARGASVFAILAALVPGKGPVGTTLDLQGKPLNRVSNVDAWLAPIATAYAQGAIPSSQMGKIRVAVSGEGDGAALVERVRQDGLAVTLRNPRNAEIVAFERIFWNRVEISQPFGRYILEVELPGFRRGRTEVVVDKEAQALDLRMTDKTILPLSVQRLLPSSELELRPNEEETAKFRGAELARRGDFSAAINYYNKSLELAAKDKETLNFKGYALYKLGRAVEAMNVLMEAVEVAPAYFLARLNLAKAACQAGKAEVAREAMLGNPKISKDNLVLAIQDGEFKRDCKDLTINIQQQFGP